MTTDTELVKVKAEKKLMTLDQFNTYSNCAYTKYGTGVTINIDVFTCNTCSKTVCEECLFTCHNQDCLKSKNPPAPCFFVDSTCECGKEGHADRKKTNIALKAECNLGDIYNNYPMHKYSCENCQMNFCFICFYECHGRSCSTDKMKLVEDLAFKCSCIHYNHDNNNFLFRLLQGEKLGEIAHLSRIYSNAFKNNLMDKYLRLITKTIAEGQHTTLSKGDYNLYEFDISHLLHSYREEVKHFFYFPNELLCKFPYQSLTDAFSTCDDTMKQDDYAEHLATSFRFRHNFLISILHLKNDFKKFKKLSPHYFINTSLSERLKLRFLIQNEIKTSYFAKYKFTVDGEEEMSFSDFINHNITLLKFDYYPYRSLDIILARAFKSHIFGTEDIIKFIKTFVKLPKSNYEKIKIDNLTRLAFAYNDTIIYETIEKKEMLNYKFLHKRSDFSEAFLKVYLGYINTMIENKEFDYNYSDLTKQRTCKNFAKFKDIIKLFSVAENSFSEDLEDFEREGYQDYCRFVKLYNDLNDPSKSDRFEHKFSKLVRGLVEAIDDECRKFYFYESSYYDRIISLFSSFADSYGRLLSQYKRQAEEEELDSKKKRHFERIFDSTKIRLSQFITHQNFCHHLTSPLFMEVLKIEHFLRTLFLILESTQKEKRNDKEKLIEMVFSYISILTVTKGSLEFLISNNIFKKIGKLFESFRPHTLELIYLILKGLKLHNIEIKCKLSLQNLTESVVKYFLTLSLNDFNTKPQAILVVKILMLISEQLDFTQMKEVKRTIFKHLHKTNTFTQEGFVNSFPNLNNEKYSINSVKGQAIQYQNNTNINPSNTRTRFGICDENDIFLETLQRNPTQEGLDNLDEEKGMLDEKKLLKTKTSVNNVISHEDKRKKQFSKLARYKFLSFFHRIVPFVNSSDIGNHDQFYGVKTNTYVNQKIFFSFFKLIAHNTFFVLKNDSFKECIDFLQGFNDIDYYQKLLSTNYISIDKRTSMLKYLYSLYFLDIIGDASTNQNLINSEEISNYERYKEYLELIELYKDCEKNTTVKFEDMKKNLKQEDYKYFKYRAITEKNENGGYKENFDSLSKKMKNIKDIEAKYNFTQAFMKVMNLFCQEVENMFYWVFSSKNDIKDIEKYVLTIMDLMRFVSDFFWDVYKKTNMYNTLITLYYKLASVFIQNIENIKKVIDSFKDKSNENHYKYVASSIISNYRAASEQIKFVREFKSIDKFFDTKKIYHNVLEGLNYLNMENMKDEYLQNFFRNYDNQVTKDFFTIGIEFDGQFEYFYNDNAHQPEPNNNSDSNLIKELCRDYKEKFKNIKDTSFFIVLNNLSTEANVCKSISNLFFTYYEQGVFIDEDFEFSLAHMITKILYYDTRKYQDIMSTILNDKFFINYFDRVQTCMAIYISACDKFYTNNRYSTYMNMKTKIMLQFLQLLGEGFYTGFLDKIFNNIEITQEQYNNFYKIKSYYNSVEYEFLEKIVNPPKPEEQKPKPENDGGNNGAIEEVNTNSQDVPKPVEKKKYINIYKHFYDQLIYLNRFFINIKDWDFNVQYHLSDDHLVILLSNLTSFIVEYNGNYKGKYNTSCVVAATADQENDGQDDSDNLDKLTILDLIRNSLNISQILFLRENNLHLNRRRIILFAKLNYLSLLTSFIQNREFEDIVKDFNATIVKTKLYEEIMFYLEFLLKAKGNSLETNRTAANQLLSMYIKDAEFESSIELHYCIDAFIYIRIISSKYNDEEMINFFKAIKNEDIDPNIFNSDEVSYDSISGWRAFKFLNQIVQSVTTCTRIDDKNPDANKSKEDSINKIFFVKPQFSFQLSEQTKQKFLDNVDRTSATTKLKEIIDFTDYFVFEMFYNYHRFSQIPILESFNKIRMYYFEVFNYLLVIIHQILLFVHFYKAKNMSNIDDVNFFTEEEKFYINPGNEALSIIQIVYLAICISIWFLIFSKLNYQKLLMREFDINFVVSTFGEKKSKNQRAIKFTDDFIADNEELLEKLNDEVSIWSKLRIIGTDLILFNREVNFFILDIVLLILYLSSKNSICLVIPVVLITNLSVFLYDILYVIQLKWKQLALVIFYTYLLVYLFSWIAFLYLPDLFVTETLDIPSVNLNLILGNRK
jgi:hypothetical protein